MLCCSSTDITGFMVINLVLLFNMFIKDREKISLKSSRQKEKKTRLHNACVKLFRMEMEVTKR